tara:strand:+ start:4354 stop:4635 length:282 start_codon:yes stop_codon:yes gene_type:complete
MPEWLITVAATGSALILGIVGTLLTGRKDKRSAESTLIDQLQEELAGYRAATDKRLDKLEAENAAYRRYVFALLDHGDSHGIERLPWPNELPR